jgi:phosphoribosylglycinamide formyltransferase 1
LKNIVIFASGSGSNAENICKQFAGSNEIRVAALFCNNPQAGVIAKMKPFGVPVHLFTKAEISNESLFLSMLEPYSPDLIVLAGFLWLIPAYLVKAYPGRIINIHPALLPKFGGKGMYGHHVHRSRACAKGNGARDHHSFCEREIR